MKKFISILLALTLVLSLGVVAFADDGAPTEPETPLTSTATTFNIKKEYIVVGGTNVYPTEVLKFNVTAKEGYTNPDETMISIADHTIDGNPDNEIAVTVPAYHNVGKWNYTVTEEQGNTQGVVYNTNSFDVQVVVTYNTAGTALEVQTTFTSKTGSDVIITNGKVDGIKNTYNLGTLTVDKAVFGNLASDTQKFDIDVVFTSPKEVKSAIDGVTSWTFDETKHAYISNTVTLHIADVDGLYTIANIPADVQYTVTEQAKHAAPDANGSDATKGYTVTYEKENGTIVTNTTAAAVVTNTKGTTVDTGISVDSIPYVVLAVVSVVGLAVFFSRKRVIE